VFCIAFVVIVAGEATKLDWTEHGMAGVFWVSESTFWWVWLCLLFLVVRWLSI
jgi:hypothetical protein